MDTHFSLDRALDATGALLARRGQQAAIVVVGGTALNLLGVVDRVTRDVAVIGPASRHFNDLVALRPTRQELAAGRAWVESQDPSPAMAEALQQVIAHVQAEGR